ncbi:MAG: YicC/YloC family endoribonuclease [Sphaerochaetaceae bacterium]|jgi:uncharacterized protein (TIGR00255 family)|nr:YicC family protein [Sphaerochaetaceae bacterium]MDD3366864.1 YicC family protein [Sphaerochaetaceae bacterium]MDD4218571.1 YicC family protein [Sphaerochaetaceae bacterium]
MLSMTGFGYSERLTEDFLLTVELKSYNSRYLEIIHNIPPSLSSFEIALDERIKTVVSRGRVELNIRLRQLKTDLNLRVDEAAVQQYKTAFATIQRLAGLQQEATLQDFLLTEGVLVPLRDSDVSRYKEPLFDLLDEVLVVFKASKEREGAATKRDLFRLGTQLQSSLDGVVSNADALEEKLKENLINRFEELLGEKGYDENRFLQEVAMLLAKYSINEEIVRLQAHIEAFHDLLESNEPIGKRLDFLAQEMNREINTIGSKSIMIEVNQQVIALKDNLENIREQVRNIE